MELLGKELVFPSYLEGPEDMFWALDEKLECSSQSLCIYLYSFETIKREWGKVVLKMRKGWLERRASHLSHVWIFVSSSHRSTQGGSGLLYACLYLKMENSSSQLTGWSLLMIQSCCIPQLRRKAQSELFPTEKPGF